MPEAEAQAHALINALKMFRRSVAHSGYPHLALACVDLCDLVEDWLDDQPPTRREIPPAHATGGWVTSDGTQFVKPQPSESDGDDDIDDSSSTEEIE